MFGENWKTPDDIRIDGVTHYAFTAFLAFFYTNRIALTAQNVADILDLAQKYNVAALLDGCSRFLCDKLSVESVFDALSLSIRYHLNETKGKLIARIFGTSLLSIEKDSENAMLKTQGFMGCDVDTLHTLLQAGVILCAKTTVVRHMHPLGRAKVR